MLIIRVILTNLAFDVLIIKSIANLFIVFLYKFGIKTSKKRMLEAMENDYDGYATVCIALSAVAGVFERSKWKKKAIEAVGFMEDNFGAAFEKTVVYALLNG